MIAQKTIIEIALIYHDALKELAENEYIDPSANSWHCQDALAKAAELSGQSEVGDFLRNQLNKLG